MNSDIRILITFRNNRKRRKLDLLLGENSAGYLIDLWIGAAVSRPDGILLGWDNTDIALEANYSGSPDKFVDALKDSDFIIENGGGTLYLKNWKDRQKWAANDHARSEIASKKALRRWVLNQLAKKDYAEFNVWFDTLYEYSTEDNANSILLLFKEYAISNANSIKQDANGNAPYPSPLPLPSPLPKEVKDSVDVHSEEEKVKNKPTIPERPEFIPEDLWKPLLDNRKFKKLQNTELALKTFCNSLLPAIEQGFSIEDCIGEFVASRWTSFKAEWMVNRSSRKDRSIKNCSLCDYRIRGKCNHDKENCSSFVEGTK